MTRPVPFLAPLLLWLLVLAQPGPVCAAPAPLVLSDPEAAYSLSPHCELLEDPEGIWSLEDVIAPDLAARFRPHSGETINLGLSPSVWWLRFRLIQDQELRLPPGEEWLIDLGWPHLRSARLYIPMPGGGFLEERAGDPATLRPGETPPEDLAFLLPRFLYGNQTFYLRVQGVSSLFLPLEVLTEEGYTAKRRTHALAQGAYYGVMLAMLVLNLLLFLTLRDKSHVWYLLYVLFVSAYFLSYNGYLDRWPFHFQGGAELTARLLVIGAFICCAAQFTRTFLLTRTIAPEADVALRVVLFAALTVMALTPALPQRHVVRIFSLFGLCSPFIAVWCGALCLKRGFRPARFYLAAWAGLALGGVIHSLLFLKLLPFNDFTATAFQGSTAVEAVILALALADRIRVLRLEREKLALAEERLRSVLEALPFPLVISRQPDGLVLFANQTAHQALGLPRPALIGATGQSYYASAERRDEILAVLAAQGRVQGMEAEMGLPGIWGRKASVSATLMDYQDQKAALFVIQDVTDRRRAETALRRSEERYRTLVENTNEGVGVFQDDRVRFVNQRMLSLSGYSREELLGQDVFRFIHPEDRGEARSTARQIIGGGLPAADLSLRVFSRDGHPRWLDIHLTNIDWEGRPAVLYFATDVTHRRAMEQDLLAAKAQAEQASRAKSAFLASMSHEIRTPLSAVIGMVDLVMGGRLNEEQRDCLATASDSARHLLSIINDLLDFSKIEARKLSLERVHFDLFATVESVGRTFFLQARQRGLDLTVEIDPEAPRHVVGDPARLRQVLMNLVGNAVKFTEQGGVRLRLQAVSSGREGQVAARFLVSDSGIGISKGQLGQIFESFTQAEGSISRRYGGTGLGLAICRRLVELMGGSIAVDSEPGKGSTFFFSLCFEPGDPQLAVAGNPTPEPPAAGEAVPLRLLVVEDNPVNVRVAQLHLTQMGHEVIAAGDGHEGLALLARERFDAVLMDLEMPGMDGLEVTRRIRSTPPGPGAPLDPLVPIVAMTAHAVAEIRDRCLEAGMDGYVVKPVNFPELNDLLQRLARGEREAGRTAPPPAPPPIRDPETLPVLDRAGAMRLMGIDQSTYEAVLDHSLQEMERRLTLARQAMESGDDAALTLHAHTIKGTAAGMGAERCAHHALRLHDAAKAGERETAARALETLAAEFQSLQQAIASSETP
ncbi:7TM diverse intracellular signaling domain-containing protein [Desulfovibrio sp.]